MLIKSARKALSAAQYSLGGLRHLWMNEFAARLEIMVGVGFLILYLLLGVPMTLVMGSIVLFLILLAVEALNTAIEVLVDRVSPEISPTGKAAKDLGSLAVMCMLITNLGFATYALMIASRRPGGLLDMTDLFFMGSLISIGVSVFYFIQSAKPVKFRGLILLGVLAYFLLLCAWYTSDYFTGQGIDESVVFHVGAGLEGAGFGAYLGLSIFNIIYLTALGGAIFFLARMFGRDGDQKVKDLGLDLNASTDPQGHVPHDPEQINLPKDRVMKRWLGWAFLGGALALNPATSDLIRLSQVPFAGDVEFDLYAPVTVQEIPNKKNIVFVYLESLELTYFNEGVFPGLIKELKALEAESSSFTHIDSVYSTRFTMGGMVASQCGVPMFPPANGNTLNEYDRFMPNVTCLGDILDANGYQLEYLGGAALEFAGKGQFFSSHGFDTVSGREQHEQTITDKEAYHSWGLYDSFLYGEAKTSFDRLAQGEAPFGLFMLTLDTHHPAGHESPACKTVRYGDGSNAMLNAVKCADQQIGDFVRHIRKSPAAQDTLIVLASDHLALKNRASDLLDSTRRSNFLAIIDPVDPSARRSDRPGTTMDIPPTVLSYMGVELPFGFGRNLLGSEPTLIEAKKGELNPFLRAAENKLQKDFWDIPVIGGFLTLNAELERIQMADRWISFPTLLGLDEKADINSILLHPEIHNAMPDDYLSQQAKDQDRFFLVDRCEFIRDHFDAVVSGASDDWCALFKGDNGQRSVPISPGLENKVLRKEIERVL